MSTTYPYNSDIELSQLRADPNNYRLPDHQTSQRDAFHSMARAQGSKLIALAEHIVNNGLNPTQKLIAIKDDDERDQYIIYDGNRRLTALRALETPSLIEDELSSKDAAKLKSLAQRYAGNEIQQVPCVVFESTEQADKWLDLIHDGESGGAGTVKWKSLQIQRRNSRRAGPAEHIQVLDFVRHHGALSDEVAQQIDDGSYPQSTLLRVLSTPHVRVKLGIEYKDKKVYSLYPPEEVLKGLTKVVDDIGSRRVQASRDLNFAPDRKRYIDAFHPEDLPTSSTRIDAIEIGLSEPNKLELQDGKESEGSPGTPEPDPPPVQNPRSSSRRKLIPTTVTLTIPDRRINDIFLELKRQLVVADSPNAVAVLMRVLLELSADAYIARNGIKGLKKGEKALLHLKIDAIAKYMKDQGVFVKEQLEPIRRAVNNVNDPNSIRTMHGYVHNRRFSPGPDDLKAMWDSLEFFFRALWP
ncbi:MAG: hypothetical protein AAGJ10_13860 [Bacteroidota bacterium]